MLSKFLSIIIYFYYRFFALWFEVRSNRLQLFIYEMHFLINQIFVSRILSSNLYSLSSVHSIFGFFNIRPGTDDFFCVRPSFERPDINHLFSILSSSVKKNSKILFVDVGADLGYYTVSVGNLLKGYTNYDIYSFEPSKANYLYLEKNITSNNLDKSRVHTFNFGLSNTNQTSSLFFDTITPSSSSLYRTPQLENTLIAVENIELKRLDDVFKKIIFDYDVLIIKLDVEGYEKSVLEGSMNTIRSSPTTYLLVEDFLFPEIKDYLNNNNFRQLAKFTSYNSWWRYQNDKKVY